MGTKFFKLWAIGALAVVLSGCACGSPFRRGEQLESAAESYIHPQESQIDSTSESE